MNAPLKCSGLPLFLGAQLAVDITIRNILTASSAFQTHPTPTAWFYCKPEERRSASMRNCWLVSCRIVVVGAGQCPKVGGADGHVSACSFVSPSSVGPVGAEGGVFPSWPICSQSEWSVRGGPCEVVLLFSANFLSAVSFQLLFVV